jgi:hypothetical protein
VPLGYQVKDKKLVVHEPEAEQVRLIFSRYLELKCLTALARDLRERGIVTKVSHRRDGSIRGGIAFTKGPLAYLLRNRAYIGEVIHKGQHYPGEQEPIVPHDLFEAVQEELSAKAHGRGAQRINQSSLLVGLLFDDRGNRMTPTTSKKGGARYRYYTSAALHQGRKDEAGSVSRVPALDLEAVVLKALAEGSRACSPNSHDRDWTKDPEVIRSLIERVIVRSGAIEIVRLSPEDEEQPAPIVVPWSPVSGRHRREIIGVEAVSAARPIRSETRARLVEAIAKARQWLDELLSGHMKDTHEIAAREACSERSVRMTLNLAFLSPALVQAAVEGRLPHGAGLSSLTDAPLNWKEQQRSLIGTSF